MASKILCSNMQTASPVSVYDNDIRTDAGAGIRGCMGSWRWPDCPGKAWRPQCCRMHTLAVGPRCKTSAQEDSPGPAYHCCRRIPWVTCCSGERPGTARAAGRSSCCACSLRRHARPRSARRRRWMPGSPGGAGRAWSQTLPASMNGRGRTLRRTSDPAEVMLTPQQEALPRRLRGQGMCPFIPHVTQQALTVSGLVPLVCGIWILVCARYSTQMGPFQNTTGGRQSSENAQCGGCTAGGGC